MSDAQTFPRTAYEALTMRYLDTVDISALTPSEFVDKYNEIYAEIVTRYDATIKLRTVKR